MTGHYITTQKYGCGSAGRAGSPAKGTQPHTPPHVSSLCKINENCSPGTLIKDVLQLANIKPECCKDKCRRKSKDQQCLVFLMWPVMMICEIFRIYREMDKLPQISICHTAAPPVDWNPTMHCKL